MRSLKQDQSGAGGAGRNSCAQEVTQELEFLLISLFECRLILSFETLSPPPPHTCSGRWEGGERGSREKGFPVPLYW